MTCPKTHPLTPAGIAMVFVFAMALVILGQGLLTVATQGEHPLLHTTLFFLGTAQAAGVLGLFVATALNTSHTHTDSHKHTRVVLITCLLFTPGTLTAGGLLWLFPQNPKAGLIVLFTQNLLTILPMLLGNRSRLLLQEWVKRPTDSVPGFTHTDPAIFTVPVVTVNKIVWSVHVLPNRWPWKWFSQPSSHTVPTQTALKFQDLILTHLLETPKDVLKLSVKIPSLFLDTPELTVANRNKTETLQGREVQALLNQLWPWIQTLPVVIDSELRQREHVQHFLRIDRPLSSHENMALQRQRTGFRLGKVKNKPT